jgi:hypothetical protein
MPELVYKLKVGSVKGLVGAKYRESHIGFSLVIRAILYGPSAMSYQLSTMNYELSAMSYELSAMSYQL